MRTLPNTGGIEAFYDWRPLTGLATVWRLHSYCMPSTLIFTDRTAVDLLTRDGKNVPNVPTDVLIAKVEYDHPDRMGRLGRRQAITIATS